MSNVPSGARNTEYCQCNDSAIYCWRFICQDVFCKIFVIINKLQDCFQMRKGVFLPNIGQLVVFRLLKMMINRTEYMYKYILIEFCLFI